MMSFNHDLDSQKALAVSDYSGFVAMGDDLYGAPNANGL